MAYDVGRRLGQSTRSRLLDFILSAGDGARLTLQKNRGGFTVQVTKAVQRSEEEPLELEELKAWRTRLNAS